LVHISLQNIGKRFNREWIFRRLNLELPPGSRLVIQGGNGSGKSTLIQMISGFVTPTEGTILIKNSAGQPLGEEKIKDVVSLASPYLQLLEDLTAPELISHLRLYKKFRHNMGGDQILEVSELLHVRKKHIRHYSSGMKQRLKLALAILADTPLLLLDEPLSNLDQKAGEWYKKMVEHYCGDRTVIVCSNAITSEHFFCDRSLNVMDFKS
jgi:ABC-type multidrug transport system ATPase subunit